MRKLLEGIEPVDRAAYNAAAYDERDVEAIGRRLQLGDYRRDALTVVVHHTLEPQAQALEAAGLVVERVTTMLEALSVQRYGMPILVVPARLPDHDAEALDTVVDGTYTVLIGPEDHARARTRMRAVCMDHDELRKLVRHAWSLVQVRIDQVALKL